eukprot:8021155-Lingulodinium_polyedra.AAC.1
MSITSAGTVSQRRCMLYMPRYAKLQQPTTAALLAGTAACKPQIAEAAGQQHAQLAGVGLRDLRHPLPGCVRAREL